MNEKIKEIEKFLMEWMVVSLSKQCKQEYIVYTFYINTKREKVIIQIKEHFGNKELDNPGKYKKKKIEIPIDVFLNEMVYELLNKGYELETWQ